MTDICLLLEGTYPYVAGGVSSWVDQLLNRYKDLTFSILYLGPRRSAQKKMHYKIPENVVDFREIYLFDYQIRKEHTKPGKKKDFEILFSFFKDMRSGNVALLPELLRIIGNPETRTISLHDLAHSLEGWEMLLKLYNTEGEETSFLDYFWTWRFLFLPFFSLLRIDLPQARMYHSVSTGYAGAIGAMAKLKYNRPYLLTEHGIYTRERKIEISKADWIFSKEANEIIVSDDREFFREWWIQLFSFLSKVSYEWADEIITLFDGNKKIEIEEGADPNKISVIPNGVDFQSLSTLKSKTDKSVYRIGLVGRVVPIKDIKTFIKAARKIYDDLPNVEILVIGPWDEDEDYYKECLFLVEMESLKNVVKFTGKVRVSDYYPMLDIMVLTSISEAQPIAILEAEACGIPVVATDVGACRELVYGRTPDDQLLGVCGEIVPICNPEAVSKAVIKILKDPSLCKKMGNIGKKRVEMYYQMDDLVARYHAKYIQYTEQACV